LLIKQTLTQREEKEELKLKKSKRTHHKKSERIRKSKKNKENELDQNSNDFRIINEMDNKLTNEIISHSKPQYTLSEYQDQNAMYFQGIVEKTVELFEMKSSIAESSGIKELAKD
jgi:hypothetical protein